MFTHYRAIGVLRVLSLAYFKCFSFLFYKPRFRACRSITLQDSPRLIGCRFISIGTLTAGRFLRLEALNFLDHPPVLSIGSNVSFGDSCHIACINSVKISDHVLVGSGVYITDHDHGNYGASVEASSPNSPPASRALASVGVSIGTNTYIGEHVVILPGVQIGQGCVIGAGSVVTHDIPDFCIAAGVPCRPFKRYNFSQFQWTSL